MGADDSTAAERGMLSWDAGTQKWKRFESGPFSGVTDTVRLKDAAGTTVINPATREGQEEIETDVEAVVTSLSDVNTELNTITARLDSLLLLTDTVEAKLQSILDALPSAGLMERMFAKRPAAGYKLWFDLANTSHLYMLEAPSAATAASTGFRGVRVPLDLLGNIIGEAELNESVTLTFNNRTTDPGWS